MPTCSKPGASGAEAAGPPGGGARGARQGAAAAVDCVFVKGGFFVGDAFADRRHPNGVVSNGVVPTSQISKSVAKPAPRIILDTTEIIGFARNFHPTKMKLLSVGFGGINRPC